MKKGFFLLSLTCYIIILFLGYVFAYNASPISSAELPYTIQPTLSANLVQQQGSLVSPSQFGINSYRDYGVVGVGARYSIPCESDSSKTCYMNRWPANSNYGMVFHSSYTPVTNPPTLMSEYRFTGDIYYYNIREYMNENGQVYKAILHFIPAAYEADEHGPIVLDLDGGYLASQMKSVVMPDGSLNSMCPGYYSGGKRVGRAALNGPITITVNRQGPAIAHVQSTYNYNIRWDQSTYRQGTGSDVTSDDAFIIPWSSMSFKDSNLGWCTPGNFKCNYKGSTAFPQHNENPGVLGNQDRPQMVVEIQVDVTNPSLNQKSNNDPLKGLIDVGAYRIAAFRIREKALAPSGDCQIMETMESIMRAPGDTRSKSPMADTYDPSAPSVQYGFIAGSAPQKGGNDYFKWLVHTIDYNNYLNVADFGTVGNEKHMTAWPGDKGPFFKMWPDAAKYRDWIWNLGMENMVNNNQVPSDPSWNSYANWYPTSKAVYAVYKGVNNLVPFDENRFTTFVGDFVSGNVCYDACTSAGVRECSGVNVKECRQITPTCKQWVSTTCSAGTICSAGNCVACSNQCTAGQKQCSGNGVLSCELANNCYAWGAVTACGANQQCSNGACSNLPCVGATDTCTTNGAKKCSGTNGYVTCGQFDADACLEWGTSVSACGSWETCFGDGICSGQGILGKYYSPFSPTDNFDSKTPALQRVDNNINFWWYGNDPATNVPGDHFGVRWEGYIKPTVTGIYTFSTVTDDGVKLWVNNQLLVDQWNAHSIDKKFSGNIALTAGQSYPVKMEYYEWEQGQIAQLLWSGPGIAEQPVPQSVLSPAAGTTTPPPVCTNECATSGQVVCEGTTGTKTCGNYDGDSCLEWSTIISCASGQTCNGNGICSLTCTNECLLNGAKECNGNGNRTCADLNGDGCLEWSGTTSCAIGQTCNSANATCSATCTNVCTLNQKQCSGTGEFQTCTTINGCNIWGSATQCGSGQGCSNGECYNIPTSQTNNGGGGGGGGGGGNRATVPQPRETYTPSVICIDECSYGVTICSGTNEFRGCGQYDNDTCSEWSNSINCNVGETCKNDTCSCDIICKFRETKEEGLYNSCTNELVKLGKCDGAQISNWCLGADIDKSGSVGLGDLFKTIFRWGRSNCNEENEFCRGSDIDKDGKVRWTDMRKIIKGFGSSDCSGSG